MRNFKGPIRIKNADEIGKKYSINVDLVHNIPYGGLKLPYYYYYVITTQDNEIIASISVNAKIDSVDIVANHDIIDRICGKTVVYIDWLYVCYKYRGRGLGGVLLDFIKKKFEGQPLVLRTRVLNTSATPFYLKHGFKIVDTVGIRHIWVYEPNSVVTEEYDIFKKW